MKTLLLLAAALALLCGCDRQAEPTVTGKINNVPIVRIDGCQYLENGIYTSTGGGNVYTHKGNCDNLIHARQ